MTQIRSIDTAEDAAKGRGHAVITLQGVESRGQACRIVLSRGSGANAEYLGALGWQSTQVRIIPDGIEDADGNLRLFAGPTVVQHMVRGNFFLTLVLGERSLEPKAFSWKLAGYRMPRGRLETPQTINVEESAEAPKTDIYRATISQAPSSPVSPAASAPSAPASAIEEHSEPAAPIQAGSEKSPKPLLKWVITGVAGLAVAAGVTGYFLLGNAEPPTMASTPAASEPVAEDAPADTPSEGSAASPETLSAEEEVRRFLATDPTTDAITAKADEMMQRDHPGLTVTLLRRAGDAGDVHALMKVARIYDPVADGGNHVVTEKRPQFAYNFYRKAERLGDADATAAIERLKDWARDQAATGDREASQLLRLIALEN